MVMTWTICGTVTGGGRDVAGRPEAAIAVAAAANKQCFGEILIVRKTKKK
jgi:hypothetical protein